MVSALGPSGLAQDVLGVERLPSIYGFSGAWLVLTAFTFPYVLLPVQARAAPPRPVARGGRARAGPHAPRRSFRTVVLPQLVPAIGAGGLLVALYVLSDFGAVSILRFDSFTRVIYTSYRSSFDRDGAAALAALLVARDRSRPVARGRARARARAYHRVAPRRRARAPRRPARALALAGARLRRRGRAASRSCCRSGVLVYWATRSVAGERRLGRRRAARRATRCSPPRSPPRSARRARCRSRCSPRATPAARRR